MADVETLTDAHREKLLDLTLPHGEGELVLRIIDGLTERCAELEDQLFNGPPDDRTRTEAEPDEPLRCDNCGSTLHLEPVDLGNGVSCKEGYGCYRWSEADQAVLDAAARMKFSNDGCDCIEIHDDGGLPEAELARREAKR